MTETLVPKGLDPQGRRQAHATSAAGLHLPGGPPTQLPASAPVGLRTGPSRRATAALLQKALAAVDTRLVAQLSQIPQGTATRGPAPLSGDARLEVAWLLRADRMLRHSLASPNDDVVLCDSQAELAEGVQAALVDLDGEVGQRALRLLEFLRELCSELTVLRSAQAQTLKQRLQRLRQAVEQKSRGGALLARQLPAVMQNAAKLYADLDQEMERLSPRAHPDLLDQVTRGL